MKNLTKRITSALIFGPIILAALWWSDLTTLLLMEVLAIGMVSEFWSFPETSITLPQKALLVMHPIITGVTFYLDLFDFYFPYLITLILVATLTELLKKEPEGTQIRLGTLFIAILIYGTLPLCAIGLRKMGRIYVLLPLIIAWVSDSLAYFGGLRFGKKKLVPTISPKKTITGCGFSIFGSILVGFFFYALSHLNLASAILPALLGGFIDQLGDLLESKFKRDASIKDSSNLIPGHGGFLDRFDSLTLLFPFFYLFFIFYA